MNDLEHEVAMGVKCIRDSIDELSKLSEQSRYGRALVLRELSSLEAALNQQFVLVTSLRNSSHLKAVS